MPWPTYRHVEVLFEAGTRRQLPRHLEQLAAEHTGPRRLDNGPLHCHHGADDVGLLGAGTADDQRPGYLRDVAAADVAEVELDRIVGLECAGRC